MTIPLTPDQVTLNQDYYKSLVSLAHLGLSLTKIPNGVWTTVRLQCAIKDLEMGLLKVQIAIMRDELENDQRKQAVSS